MNSRKRTQNDAKRVELTHLVFAMSALLHCTAIQKEKHRYPKRKANMLVLV